MSKKSIAGTVATLSFIAFSIFSFSNALALGDAMGDTAGSAPLTSPRVLCKKARTNYGRDVQNIKAKGLSLQLSEEEILAQIAALKNYRKMVCNKAAALTSAVKLCKEAKKNYAEEAKNTRARGLSLHLSEEEINANIKALKDYRKQVCKEAQSKETAQ